MWKVFGGVGWVHSDLNQHFFWFLTEDWINSGSSILVITEM